MSMLRASSLDAVILNAQHNFAWLTGGGCNGVDLSRENGVASLMITRKGKRYLLANTIEINRMLTEQVSTGEFEPVEYSWQDEKADSGCALGKVRQIAGANAEIVTDIPMFASVQAIEGKIAACRYRLTREEVARFRRLGEDAGLAMSRTVGVIEQGESEIEIAEKLRHEFALDKMSPVVTLVAADERIAMFRHPLPTDKRWGKTLLLVTCVKRHGLIASLSRMVSIGKPSDDLMFRTESAAAVNAALYEATRPGTSGSDLYRVATSAYADSNFADEINKHHQGGAAGYKTREWVAHPGSVDAVQDQQAFAWNPSITGTKVEETCIVADSGIEVITASPNVPVITSFVNGREYHSPGIISL